MKYPQHKQEIEQLLMQDGPLTIRDFSSVLKESPMVSVYARVRELVEGGRLSCIGKGKYLPVHKPEYRPVVTPWMQEVANYLNDTLEGIDHCVIQKGRNLEVQAYRGEVSQVMNSLKTVYGKVVFKKDVHAVAHSLDGFIFVAPMVSEAPLLQVDGMKVPSMEKELVDSIVSGTSAKDLLITFQRQLEVHPVNYDRLKRYAARRGVKEELNQILASLNSERIEMFTKIQKYLEKTAVSKAWLFGSYARGEEKESSDVDLLVDYDKTAGLSLLTIVRYKLDMEKLIGREVDLVENGYLKPFAVPSAEHDKYLIYER